MKRYLLILLLFPVFHAQTLSLGIFTIDQLSKIAIVVGILYLNLSQGRLSADPISIILLMRSVKSLTLVSDMYSISTMIMECIRYVSAWNIYSFGQNFPKIAQNFVRWIVLALSLFSLPYLLGVLDSLSSGFDLSIYGGDGAGFVGSFLNPHSAGITHSACLIYIGASWAQRRFDRLYGRATLVLFVLNLAVVYFSFARTAWFMSAVGLLIPTFVLLKWNRSARLAIPLALAFAIILAASSETVVNRLMDINAFHAERTDDLIASGRLIFWRASVEIFGDMNFFQMWFGIGRESAVLEMYYRIGRPLESHNGFLDTLVQQGLIGIILEFTHLYILLMVSLKYFRNGDVLVLSMTISYFSMYIFQGGSFFYWEAIYYGMLAVTSASYSKNISGGVNIANNRYSS